jgi:hypothetical protein
LFASRFMKACCREISCALNEGIGPFFILQDALPFPFEVQRDVSLSSIHDDRMYVSLCFKKHKAFNKQVYLKTLSREEASLTNPLRIGDFLTRNHQPGLLITKIQHLSKKM